MLLVGLQPAFNFARLLDKYSEVKVAGTSENVCVKSACQYSGLQETTTGHTIVGTENTHAVLFLPPSKSVVLNLLAFYLFIF